MHDDDQLVSHHEARAVERVSQSIGSTIHGLRIGARPPVSQARLASISGVSQQMISNLERGDRSSNFNLDSLRAIALALGQPSLASLIFAAEKNLR